LEAKNVPDTFYAICATMRTGTTLLHFLLRDAGLGNADEYLHGNKPTQPSFAGYAAQVLEGQPDAIAGCNFMWGHAWGTQKRLPDVWRGVKAEHIFDGVIDAIGATTNRFVYIYRRSLPHQATSVLRAEHVGRWRLGVDNGRQDVEIPYCPRTVGRYRGLINNFRHCNNQWRRWFETRAIEPYTIAYEDFTRDQHSIYATLVDVVQHIGVTLPDDYQFHVPLRKQAGADVERWLECYERDYGDLMHVG
jgi:LPS sulfotransferase NodH